MDQGHMRVWYGILSRELREKEVREALRINGIASAEGWKIFEDLMWQKGNETPQYWVGLLHPSSIIVGPHSQFIGLHLWRSHRLDLGVHVPRARQARCPRRKWQHNRLGLRQMANIPRSHRRWPRLAIQVVLRGQPKSRLTLPRRRPSCHRRVCSHPPGHPRNLTHDHPGPSNAPARCAHLPVRPAPPTGASSMPTTVPAWTSTWPTTATSPRLISGPGTRPSRVNDPLGSRVCGPLARDSLARRGPSLPSFASKVRLARKKEKARPLLFVANTADPMSRIESVQGMVEMYKGREL